MCFSKEARRRRRKMALASLVLDLLLVGTPHSNLAGRGCEILIGWYPPSGGISKQLLLATPHLGGLGGGASKDLEYK